MKLVYLIPPSEWKREGGAQTPLSRSFDFEIPAQILSSATSKDLKCIDKRFEEAKMLNAQILTSPTLPAIERYDGVMYRAIGANSFDKRTAKFFDEHVLILSGLFGLVKTTDRIPNYKLPIDAHGLVQFWREKVTQELRSMEDVIFIDLLPLSYRKMIDWDQIPNFITVEFVDDELSRVGHGVKTIKGHWLRQMIDERVRTPSKLQGTLDRRSKILFVKNVSEKS